MVLIFWLLVLELVLRIGGMDMWWKLMHLPVKQFGNSTIKLAREIDLVSKPFILPMMEDLLSVDIHMHNVSLAFFSAVDNITWKRRVLKLIKYFIATGFQGFKSGGSVEDGRPVLHKFGADVASANSLSGEPTPVEGSKTKYLIHFLYKLYTLIQ